MIDGLRTAILRLREPIAILCLRARDRRLLIFRSKRCGDTFL